MNVIDILNRALVIAENQGAITFEQAQIASLWLDVMEGVE